MDATAIALLAVQSCGSWESSFVVKGIPPLPLLSSRKGRFYTASSNVRLRPPGESDLRRAVCS